MIRTDVLKERKIFTLEELMMKISQKTATKWVSLMEPTERKLTNTTFINEAEKPVINQEQLQEFDRKLKKAVDNSFQTILSKVKSIDNEKGFIYIVHGEQTKMPLTNIISIDLKLKREKETTIIYRGAM